MSRGLHATTPTLEFKFDELIKIKDDSKPIVTTVFWDWNEFLVIEILQM